MDLGGLSPPNFAYVNSLMQSDYLLSRLICILYSYDSVFGIYKREWWMVMGTNQSQSSYSFYTSYLTHWLISITQKQLFLLHVLLPLPISYPSNMREFFIFKMSQFKFNHKYNNISINLISRKKQKQWKFIPIQFVWYILYTI